MHENPKSTDVHYNTTTTNSASGAYFGINGGAAFFITKNIALEGLVNYNAISMTEDDDSKTVLTSSNLRLTCGFSIHF